jgi:hypothetical protein
MADQGGIFPNRTLFMDRPPACRGVLAAAAAAAAAPPLLDPLAVCDGAASATAIPAEGATVDMVPAAAAASAEGAKEAARRSQACKPWVCYGNPR